MIVKKTWEKLRASSRSPRKHSYDGYGRDTPQYHDTYTGWFLLGIIPLYITRHREALVDLRAKI